MMMMTEVRWGTWEELVLGGAVLRHGPHNWDAVAAELRARTTTSPHLFTSQECQSKYEDIKEKYSGCDAWFEELRKRRVAELKRELEKSEDSIGSLQSKLENLTSERETDSNSGYNTIQSESTVPAEDGDDSSSKEVSKDGISAGSFTENTGTNWTSKCQNLPSVSVQQNNFKVQSPEDSWKKFGCGCLEIGFKTFKKKRGKRKRKCCATVKERTAGDSDMFSSAALADREGSTEGCNEESKLLSEDYDGTSVVENYSHMDLTRIMDSIMKNKDASIFRGRLESQKKARYKKMIRRHVDLRSISSKIGSGSICSVKELFRDLLLLCNNILVFYHKNSPEHKSALVLRDLVNKELRQSFSSWCPAPSPCDTGGSVPDAGVLPKKCRSVLQHCIIKNAAAVDRKGDKTPVEKKKKKTPSKENRGVAPKGEAKEKRVVTEKGDGAPLKELGDNIKCALPIESRVKKRGAVGRSIKGGQKCGGRKRQETPSKGRKRTRR